MTHRTDAEATAVEMVWDRFVRLFHWGLAACVAIAAVTGFLLGATWIDVHLWAGTVGLALVAARTLWGVWGPTHARFADFFTGPRAALAHLRDLRAGRVHRHRGHNPLGGLMVLALMGVVGLLALTGALAYGGVLKSGPFAFAESFAAGWTAREIHEALAIALLALVALHVGGVVFESRRLRENLARAMVDGRKAIRPGDVLSHPVHARAATAVLLGSGAFIVAASVAGKLSELPAPNMPVATLDPTYAAECGACHAAYNPSLMPRVSWSVLMSGLDDHFGEDAWLPDDTAAQIGAWLEANAAETADTKAANLFRRVNPENPIAITATPFWTRTHADIPDAVFAAAPVGGRAQCPACHGDAAAGLFHPSNIAIPEETTR
jgi:cytochrome b